jgi:hypothetical protein
MLYYLNLDFFVVMLLFRKEHDLQQMHVEIIADLKRKQFLQNFKQSFLAEHDQPGNIC